MKPYRVLVTGSRSWRSPNDRQTLRDALDVVLAEFPTLVLIHGACSRGADFLAQRWAEDRNRAGAGISIEQHPADWERYRRAAGFRRNAEMVATRPGLVLAFIRNGSPGATHCASLAEKAGIPVRRWTQP